jgi:succinate-semialdehyde dehydrogenase/glutarate-semialdehyde dehydrogenase
MAGPKDTSPTQQQQQQPSTTTTAPPSSTTGTSSTLGVSESLASRIKDLDLLRTQGYIGGEWASAPDGASYEVSNPADGRRVATVARLGADAARAAVAAAHAALPAWAALPAKQRCLLLRKWHDLIVQSSDDIAAIMTAECGKPTAEAKAEIAAGAASVEWFAEQARRVTGEVLEPPLRDRRMLVLRQPIGVVAAITPWNFPMSMVTRKVAPALAAGCPVVLKPAESTPLTALALAELADRAGLPDGVLNVVSGDAAAIGK